jgi:hypothetical protein
MLLYNGYSCLGGWGGGGGWALSEKIDGIVILFLGMWRGVGLLHGCGGGELDSAMDGEGKSWTLLRKLEGGSWTFPGKVVDEKPYT